MRADKWTQNLHTCFVFLVSNPGLDRAALKHSALGGGLASSAAALMDDTITALGTPLLVILLPAYVRTRTTTVGQLVVPECNILS